MPNLDTIATESRQRADDIALQKQMLGSQLEDPVQLEAQIPPKPNEDMNAGNRRSDEELAAMGKSYDQIPPQEHPVISGVREVFKQAEKGIDAGTKALSDPRTEAIGLGLTTGGVATGQPEL